MWDVIKMSDAVLEAISPVSTMAIFVAPRQLIKKFFEKLFTMYEVKEAYHAHTLTQHTHTHTHTYTHIYNKTNVTSPSLVKEYLGKKY